MPVVPLSSITASLATLFEDAVVQRASRASVLAQVLPTDDGTSGGKVRLHPRPDVFRWDVDTSAAPVTIDLPPAPSA